MEIKKILIIADESQPSVKAIKYGFKLSKEFGANAALMNVVEPSLAIGNVDAGIFPDDAMAALKRKAADFLDRMKQMYGEGVDIEIMTSVGDVQTNVIDVANQWHADIIVTGTHGRTGLNKLLKGSIAESIIHHSAVPVFVVPVHK